MCNFASLNSGYFKSWDSSDEADIVNGFLFKYCSVKYQAIHQVPEKIPANIFAEKTT